MGKNRNECFQYSYAVRMLGGFPNFGCRLSIYRGGVERCGPKAKQDRGEKFLYRLACISQVGGMAAGISLPVEAEGFRMEVALSIENPPGAIKVRVGRRIMTEPRCSVAPA